MELFVRSMMHAHWRALETVFEELALVSGVEITNDDAPFGCDAYSARPCHTSADDTPCPPNAIERIVDVDEGADRKPVGDVRLAEW